MKMPRLSDQTPVFKESYWRLRVVETSLEATRRAEISERVSTAMKDVFAGTSGRETDSHLRIALEHFSRSIPVSPELEVFVGKLMNDPALNISDKIYFAHRYLAMSQATPSTYNLNALFFVLQHGTDKKTLLQQYVDHYGYCGEESSSKSSDLWSCIVYAANSKPFITLCLQDPELFPVIVETYVQAELAGRRQYGKSVDGVMGSLENRASGKRQEDVDHTADEIKREASLYAPLFEAVSRDPRLAEKEATPQ